MKCVVFDFDGVLLDSEIPAFTRFQESLQLAGITVPLQELLDCIGKSTEEIARIILSRRKAEISPEALLALHYKRGSFYAVSDDVRPMDGLVELLELLNEVKVRLGIVSSTRSISVVTALNRMDILKYFDIVIGGDMLKERKPSPEGYKLALKFLGAEASESIVVEDSPAGIKAGKAAGMTVFGFKGSKPLQDTSEADFEVYSHRELIEHPVLRKVFEKR